MRSAATGKQNDNKTNKDGLSMTQEERNRWDELEALDRELTEEEDEELQAIVDRAIENEFN